MFESCCFLFEVYGNSKSSPGNRRARALRLILLQNHTEGLLERRGLVFFVAFLTFFQRNEFERSGRVAL